MSRDFFTEEVLKLKILSTDADASWLSGGDGCDGNVHNKDDEDADEADVNADELDNIS